MSIDPWFVTEAEEREMAPILARHAHEIATKPRPRGWAARQIEDVVTVACKRNHVALGMLFALIAVVLRNGGRDRLLRMLSHLVADYDAAPGIDPRRN